MTSISRRLKKRRDAESELDRLLSQPAMVNVIHYSCESFYDRYNGQSPRITSIAIRNMGSGQTTSFSIHQVAELKGIAVVEIDRQYDALERQMLDEFYEHVRANPSHSWLHWNMRDANYGFPAIEHRYKVLGGYPARIPDQQLLDLAAKLVDVYGPDYAPDPHLRSLMRLNKISHRDFLSGAEEAKAFETKDYVNLHLSTLRKVDVIHHLALRQWEGSLRTEASWRGQYGDTIGGFFEAVSDHWLYKAAGLVGIVGTLASMVIAIRH